MKSKHALAIPLAIALSGYAASGTGAEPSAGGRLEAVSIATLWQKGDPGQRLSIRGRVLGRDRSPVAGATVNIRQADGAGQYHSDRYNASVQTSADGRYQINTVLPGQEYGAKHIHLSIEHASHAPYFTEVVFKGDPNLSTAEEQSDAIALEEARFKGETILFGDYEVVLQSNAAK